jgi:hypothetical protein
MAKQRWRTAPLARARDLLALVCGWFTESFETCALNYSLGRLDELG